MRQLGFIVFLLMLLSSSHSMARDHLVFTPLPMQDAHLVVENSQRLVAYLEAVLSKPVRIRYVADYEQVVQLFKAGEIDIAHLGPLTYVALKQQFADAELLAAERGADGLDFYQCWIVAPIDGISELKKIKQSFALTQPLSTCGPYSVAPLLDQAKIKLTNLTTAYLGTHDNVALSVLRQEFEAGALSARIAEKYVPLGLRVLAKSEKLPLFPIVANRQTLSDEQRLLIQHGLLSIVADTTANWGLRQHGFMPVDDQDYDIIRQLKAATHVHTTP